MKQNILIGGAAGQGMDTLSYLFEKLLQRSGLYVFSNKDYMSRIRGGHNFIQVRFGSDRMTGHDYTLDLIVALNDETVAAHQQRLNQEGIIFGDESLKAASDQWRPLPLKRLATEAGNPKTLTVVALGVLAKFYDLEIAVAHEVLKERFRSLAEVNIRAFDLGYQCVSSERPTPNRPAKNQILISGNEAIALGAIAGGLSFYAAYPMTPSTSVMDYLSEKQNEAKLIVEQAEDEIAGINMALGASFTGVRAMTGSSGGGLSLMTESLGLAGIMETPLVVVNVQRPGPATGLPTRTEQSDLSFLLTASHGEIPRMIIAVRNPEDAFYQTARALNIADQYQMLVILMNDQYLADYQMTVDAFDFNAIKINRGLANPEDYSVDRPYRRYELTENGISPRLLPGQAKGQIVITDSDEHDAHGHITELADVRIAMMDKRMKRLELLKEEVIQEPAVYGSETAEVVFVAWGSVEGPVREAVEILEEAGIKAGALVFGDVYPLPEKRITSAKERGALLIGVEQNYTGQLAKLIRQETGIAMNHQFLKYDGRQIAAADIVKRFYELGL